MNLVICEAKPADLPGMIGVLSEDQVGGHGDSWDEARASDYRAAFDEIAAHPDMVLLVAKVEQTVLGMLHLVFQRGLTDHGALRSVLHSVFVAAAARGQGIGAKLVAEAETRAKARGARFITLTSNKKRQAAHRFYRTLDYAQSHEGFKKVLSEKTG
jgi:GNAT superfamily N-acetyltransferase